MHKYSATYHCLYCHPSGPKCVGFSTADNSVVSYSFSYPRMFLTHCLPCYNHQLSRVTETKTLRKASEDSELYLTPNLHPIPLTLFCNHSDLSVCALFFLVSLTAYAIRSVSLAFLFLLMPMGSLQMVIAAVKLKDAYSLEGKL